MQPEQLKRMLLFSWVVTLVLSPMIWLLVDGKWAWSLLFGGFWSTANIWLIQSLVFELFGSRRTLWLIVIANVKLPVFYGLGALIFYWTSVNIVSALLGFHIPIAMLILGSFMSDGANAADK